MKLNEYGHARIVPDVARAGQKGQWEITYTVGRKGIKEGGGIPSGKQTLMFIDILQACLMLWDRSDRTSIARLLEASGYRKNDLFWQVAQSISDVLPDGDKEKQTIQGFLMGKGSYMKGEVPLDTQDSKQETIFGEE